MAPRSTPRGTRPTNMVKPVGTPAPHFPVALDQPGEKTWPGAARARSAGGRLLGVSAKAEVRGVAGGDARGPERAVVLLGRRGMRGGAGVADGQVQWVDAYAA